MKIRQYFLLLILMSLPSSVLVAQQQTKPRPKSIKATVVAENTFNRFQACWHVCSMSLLVRIGDPESQQFALVHLNHMDDRGLEEKGNHWKLVEKTGRWKFEVVPGEPALAVLSKFAKTKDLSTGVETTDQVQMNQWIPLKGSENEILPFGQTIPSYEVEIGKFKAIK